ncbi:MAG: hypothetical protein GEU95_17925 [Rhizobiales bacterium]|nr:hypothetical protein [Hyphomicrobiales bacterium]
MGSTSIRSNRRPIGKNRRPIDKQVREVGDMEVRAQPESKINAMTAADAIVEALIDEGIDCVFGITGDTVLPLLDAIHKRQDRVRYVTCRFETGATAMADAYSRVSGRIGCCIFHVGPSISNAVLGVWSAHKDAVPLLVLSANLDTFRLGRNLWHEFDVMGVFEKCTKWNAQMTEAKDARRLMRTAFQVAKSGMPGVVHLDFPKDLLPLPADVESSDLSLLGGARSGAVANNPRPEGWAVERAAELLVAAKSPVILAGRTVRWENAGAELARLSERLAIPVVTTEMGRGAMSEDHPLCAGIAGHFGHGAANGLLRKADLVMGLGSRFLNVNTINWSLIPASAKLVQVESDPSEIGRQYAVDLGVHASTRAFLTELLAYLEAGNIEEKKSLKHPRVGIVKELKEDQNRRYYDTDLSAVPIKPQLIAKAVEQVCDKDAIYCVGAGLHTHFAHEIPIRLPDQYHLPAGSGTMAWAFPAGLGAKLAKPERQVVVAVGDGDFGMNAQELETSVREKLPVTAIVYNDCSYGALRLFQKNVYGGRYIGSHYGQTDLVKLAEAYGARGELVKRPDELVPALERAVKADVTTVVDVHIDGWEPHYRESEWGEFHKF